MTVHLQNAIEELKRHLVRLSTRVEESVTHAVSALENRDVLLASEVIERDAEIDSLEVEVEEECLKILALHQPVAGDLRFIVAALKINNDLERVGDLAVNIAERTEFVARKPPANVTLDFPKMAAKAQWMLKRSLDAVIEGDAQLATEVCAADDEVDGMNRDMYRLIQEAIVRNPKNVEVLTHLLSISRHLERIADLATNIAEDVIYMIRGRIVRHQVESYLRNEES